MTTKVKDPMQISNGDVISNYTIEDILGQGGMGAVYRARDNRDGRKVALKVMFDVASAQRFKIESEALSALRHPGIPAIYEVGDQPLFYYVQEIVEGPSLEKRLEDPITHPEAIKLALSMLGVLAEVHKHGYVHRDLTPNNLLLRSNEQVCLIDFGLVRVLDGNQGLTTSGELLGTPQYMAPEQIDPKVGAISPQTDLFAAGTIVYRMLCGRLPTEPGSYPRVMRQVVTAPPVPPVGLSEALAEVVLKALEKKPADRFASAQDFAAALQQAS